MFNFVVPSIQKGQAYPSLQQYSAEPYTQSWREFGSHYPNTVPVELIAHCRLHNYPYTLTTELELTNIVDNYKNNTDNKDNKPCAAADRLWYPIQWAWFNFNIDYFKLLPFTVIQAARLGIIRILFYYHEGDDPKRIKQRLDYTCRENNLSVNSFKLVTGNTAADNIQNCVHFNDHELLYFMRNKKVEKFFKTVALMRPKRFLLLSRTHKWWRATVVADLGRQGLLDCSLWSYNTEITIDDDYKHNPIEVDTLQLKDDLQAFISAGPYTCDSLTSAEHNDHSLHTAALYDDTYCSIILETHFDADGSGGAFLTEKTFKCLKHGHPFIIVGCAGSLAWLRSKGYRTFDHCIDNSYDCIQDNTQRYLAVRNTIAQIARLSSLEMSEWLASCRADLEHNSRLFLASKWDRLNSLEERLNNGK